MLRLPKVSSNAIPGDWNNMAPGQIARHAPNASEAGTVPHPCNATDFFPNILHLTLHNLPERPKYWLPFISFKFDQWTVLPVRNIKRSFEQQHAIESIYGYMMIILEFILYC